MTLPWTPFAETDEVPCETVRRARSIVSASHSGGGGRGREVLEWPYGVGGGGVTPLDTHPLHTKVTIVGKKEIYRWENVVGPFLVHKNFGSQTPALPWGGRGTRKWCGPGRPQQAPDMSAVPSGRGA